MTQPVAHTVHTDEALAVYLEPLAEGRRLLLLGEAEGTLGARLGRVAERLEIIDPSSRVPSNGEVPELPFRDGVFDLVVAVDISFLPEPRPDAVRELRRVLREDGILVLGTSPFAGGSRRRRGSPQGGLERLLGAEFRYVRVIGQAALSGFSFGAHDAPRDEDFSVDSSLVRGLRERAQRFVGFGSDLRLDLEARLWVQVPASETEPAEQAPAAPSAELLHELNRAEDEARNALHRESELLREVESLRRAQTQAERQLERGKHLERKLTEIEGDYDDAVARVRFLEHELLERDANAGRERNQYEALERGLSEARKELADAQSKRLEAERALEAARQEVGALADECKAFEARLVEAGELSLAASRERKHHETVAKDLLEELRSRERAEHVAVEHDARVTELEAERERAVQRALEAELARESATMRADELRAQLGANLAQTIPNKANEDRTRGELTGLRLRAQETEVALASIARLSSRAAASSAPGDDDELLRAKDRIDELEDYIDRMQSKVEDADRVVELEAELDRLEHRVRELTRELEEADRFAEAHAEDAERIDTFDAELEAARRRMDSLEDDLRATQDELRLARADADALRVETEARVELAQRREQDARSERDDARAALAEARGILASLAGSPGGSANTLGASAASQAEESLRSELAARDARLVDVERELANRDQRILQLEENLRAQIRGSVPPPPFGNPEG
ncbi:MAG: methyltransferase domain-containing protein [Myxococcales bacterium]